jgi:uncharacterized protein affecting Mg2+/Co2+ transport
MYSKTTRGITVTVTPYFLDDQSSPQESHYVWAYQVSIKNLSASTMKLNHRNWVIIDANGKIMNVQGEGVENKTNQKTNTPATQQKMINNPTSPTTKKIKT